MKAINIFFISLCTLLISSCTESVKSPQKKQQQPAIFPDYCDVTIPVNIAPLNFTMLQEKFDKIDARIDGSKAGSLHIQDDKLIQFPESEWKELLQANRGGSLKITVSIKKNNQWIQYRTFGINVSIYPIDYGLVYRLIAPGYEVYSKMGIYQRNLSNFEQTPIVENTLIPGTCVNCHSFNRNKPGTMSLHLRGAQGATMLKIDGKMLMLNTKTDSTISACVYPYWHPTGKYIAYSVNQTKQAFHEISSKRIEVFDGASDVVVYDIKKNMLITTKRLRTESFETFPVFSTDGKTLYFCSARKRDIQTEYNQIRYSLCKIAFDPEKGTFGDKVDTLISSTQTGKSISFPRPSFDGKYILFTMSDYGNFSIWHKEADLYLYNIKGGSYRALNEVNSDNTESYHNWSSNSHWFVFSSRRGDGLYTRPWFSSIDEKGRATKPFLLPQKNPLSYQSSLYSYNVPEFISSKVELDANEFEAKANAKQRISPGYQCR